MTTGDEHDPLTKFTRRTRTHVEGIFAGRAPDFAAMLARARELDPGAVSPTSAAEAEALAPVIPIERARDRGDEAALAPFTAATRAEIEAQIRRPRSSPPPRRRGRLAALAAGLAAVAAGLWISQAPQRVARMLAPAPGDVAAQATHEDGPARAVQTDPRTGGGEARAAGGHVEEVRPEEVAVEAVEEVAVEAVVPEATAATAARPGVEAVAPAATAARPAGDAEVERTVRRTRPAATKERVEATDAPAQPGVSLEDEAQALWQRGELAAAEQKFRAVVRVAGRTPRAELAYGDLFALAGQIRGPDGQVALAREYLAAFPGGRFADDMRAGLCQRASSAERAGCWRDYLERHPTGAHRRAAEAASEAASGGEAAP